MTRREEIAEEARAWLGTRWQHQASLKGIGCDCIGLVVGVGRALGIPAALEFDRSPRFKGYGRQPDPVMLLTGCDDLLERIPLSATDVGDVLVMRFEKEPQHFGIVSGLDPPYMVHALAQARKVVEHRIDAVWMTRVLRAYRFRGLG